MSLLKIEKHSDVLPALDLVQDEVNKEARRIFSAGGDALKVGKIKPAKEAIAYAERLGAFVEELKRLGEAWKALEATIDAAAPEVKEIVLPQKPNKPHKTGFKRKVEHVSPKTNFIVKFPNGKVIEASQARLVLAKTIEKIGPKKVADVGMLYGGEPLVAKDKSLFKKYPSQVVEIAGGWFVQAHSSTDLKMKQIMKVAKALKLDLVVTQV